MDQRDISFSTPHENILFDEVLLDLAQMHESPGFLRFWESRQVFIVLGLTGKIDKDVREDLAQKDNIPILRRASGGGTVVQGPGCLNYMVVLPKKIHPALGDLKASYQWISAKILEALKPQGIQGFFRPPSDLAIGPDEKKFSGNAQRRKRSHILHHGTLLYNFDLDLISRYLHMPAQIPDYRRLRSHDDFVTNISLDLGVFKNHLAHIFDAKLNPVSDQELALLAKSSPINF